MELKPDLFQEIGSRKKLMKTRQSGRDACAVYKRYIRSPITHSFSFDLLIVMLIGLSAIFIDKVEKHQFFHTCKNS